jgi:hypothetical protein
MARYILRNSGGAAPQDQASILAAAPNVQVVDRSPNMMLLEASEHDARDLADRLPGWSLQPEVQYRIPDARKRIMKNPGL